MKLVDLRKVGVSSKKEARSPISKRAIFRRCQDALIAGRKRLRQQQGFELFDDWLLRQVR